MPLNIRNDLIDGKEFLLSIMMGQIKHYGTLLIFIKFTCNKDKQSICVAKENILEIISRFEQTPENTQKYLFNLVKENCDTHKDLTFDSLKQVITRLKESFHNANIPEYVVPTQIINTDLSKCEVPLELVWAMFSCNISKHIEYYRSTFADSVVETQLAGSDDQDSYSE